MFVIWVGAICYEYSFFKKVVGRIPFFGGLLKIVYRRFFLNVEKFSTSGDYWKKRYRNGGNSGNGSYGILSEFKADFLNDFVMSNDVEKVIEYGCGDGNQLKLSNYPSYIGFDVSDIAIAKCDSIFRNDSSKVFKLVSDCDGEVADLVLSLDVIYHLVEDNVFEDYMNKVFESSKRFVIIYSTDTDVNEDVKAVHVKHRKFTRWVSNNKYEWSVVKCVKNKYPNNGDNSIGSSADFYVFKKVGVSGNKCNAHC